MQNRTFTATLALLALLGGFGAAGAAQAHESHPGYGAGHEGRSLHAAEHRAIRPARFAYEGRDLHRYVDRHEAWRGYGWAEPVGWRTGRWEHRCRAGRCGWWWWSGGQAYFYDRPVYPYPPALPGATFVLPAPGVALVPAPVYAAPPARIF